MSDNDKLLRNYIRLSQFNQMALIKLNERTTDEDGKERIADRR